MTCYIKKKNTFCHTLNWGNWNSGFAKLGVRWAEQDTCLHNSCINLNSTMTFKMKLNSLKWANNCHMMFRNSTAKSTFLLSTESFVWGISNHCKTARRATAAGWAETLQGSRWQAVWADCPAELAEGWGEEKSGCVIFGRRATERRSHRPGGHMGTAGICPNQ